MSRIAKIHLAAGAVSLTLLSLVTVRASTAVWTDTSPNTGDNWSAGSVSLAHDQNGDSTFSDAEAAEFSVSGIKPGDTGTGCIDVRYGGSITGAGVTNVKLYRQNLTHSDGAAGDTTVATGQLADNLTIQVNVYAAGQTCATATPTRTSVFATAALNTLGTTFADVAAVDSGWQPSASGEVRAFEITWTLPSAAPDDAQGDGATVDFVWEIRSA